MGSTASLPKAYLARTKDNGSQTIGRFKYNVFGCDTLELPWKNNAKRVSCIAAGEYICEKVGPSAKIPYPHIAVTGVDGRDGICMHRANYVRDLLGCIGIGDGLADIDNDGELDIIKSKLTFDKVMALLPDKFLLLISAPPVV